MKVPEGAARLDHVTTLPTMNLPTARAPLSQPSSAGRRRLLLGKGHQVSKTVFALAALTAISDTAAADIDFSAEIEPLLKQRCYECHSHSGKMKGGLTLDSRAGWATGGDSGPAIIAGKPDESLVIQMVRWKDDDHQMPPKEKLADAEIALLEKWVQQGAADPREPVKPEGGEWWSLKTLIKPAVPAGSSHPIDAFIQAKLQEKGLPPSPPADRRTLIRRLYFDLHGLPPTPEEVAAFEKNDDPLACEKLVDALLASPRYGERWARHWLDTIHFADTHGFEHDDIRPNAWRFRDYVIASLNGDKAWDRFIREQIAADALFPDETHLTPALGFLGAGTYDSSAAATAPTSFENLDRDDLVTQTMAAFVSTTANCARCHAHKFDPITQEDYYALQAVFAGIGKGDISYHEDPATARELRRLTALKDAADRVDQAVLLSAESEALVAAVEKNPPAAWVVLAPETYSSTEGVTLERLADHSLLASGVAPDKDIITLTATTELTSISAFRLELLADDSLPAKGPGRASNGNLHLSEFELQVFPPGAGKPERPAIRRALSDFDQADYGIAKSIDGDRKSSWAIHPQIGVSHQGIYELAAPLKTTPGTRLVITLPQLQGGGHLLGKFRLSATSSPPESLRIFPAEAGAILAIPRSNRTPEQQVALAAVILRQHATDGLSKFPAPATVWAAGRAAVNERGVVPYPEPRTIRVLKRGDLAKPGSEAAPGALSAITALPGRFVLANPKDESASRAALANWLADPANPLTWRSAVNRVWHYHFGRGLCDTPSDFGRMGSVPSHPELIDWLAVWFRDEASGSLKSLHRLIVTSAAYRQASAPNAAASTVDPDNRLLWRMNRPRLDADTIRDAILFASGKLDLTMGGPSVAHFTEKPGPQSTPVLNYDDFDLNSPAAGRRSIYRLVWRAIADPFLDALDFPDMGLLAPVRGFSASPLQSLALFNNRFILHFSEHFAARVDNAGASAEQKIQAAFRILLQRDPTAAELAEFTALAAGHGMAAVCRVLFNSNEFLFID